MISVVIPHFPYDKAIDETLKRCVDSLKGHDELILVVNQGIGYARAVNMGINLAKGDHICIVNNDLVVEAGDLTELVSDHVTSPRINELTQDFHGSFVCIPRSVIDKVGLYDEVFEGGYMEDVDYKRRLDDAGIMCECIPSVVVKHEGGTTIKAIGKEQEYITKNKERFMQKWGLSV